jgi:hypothetical protein
MADWKSAIQRMETTESARNESKPRQPFALGTLVTLGVGATLGAHLVPKKFYKSPYQSGSTPGQIGWERNIATSLGGR